MAFKRPLPEWNNPGVEPPQSKKDMGWLGREKPPAQWHNWFQHLTYEALKELQENTAHVTFGETEPASPDENDLWVDTNGYPVLILKAWDGTQWITVGAVSSVNGKTGDVELTAEDVGAASLTDFNAHLKDELQDGVHGLATTQDLTLYVDATNGDDDNDGKTPQTAFRTIQKAIDSVPKIVNHLVTVNISDGVYDEPMILVAGFIGTGSINLIGNVSSPVNVMLDKQNRTDFGILVSRNTITVNLRGLYLVGTPVNETVGINVINCSNVSIRDCIIDGFGLTHNLRGGVYVTFSSAEVIDCEFNNNGRAIISYRSSVWTNNLTGTNNSTVLQAVSGGIIAKSGSQPLGSQPESWQTGGVIFGPGAALIESMGSNANGTYVRWTNGLQICWAGRSIINWPAQTTVNTGLSHYASDFTWTFPASFIDTNIVITANPGYVGTDGSWGMTTIYQSSVTTTSVRLMLWTTHSRPETSSGTAVAIGRWK